MSAPKGSRPRSGHAGAGKPRPVSAAAVDELRGVVEPVVVAAGLDLEDLTVSRSGQGARIQLLVDRDGGVSLDECAEVSRSVAVRLDDAESRLQAGAGSLLGAAYTLEVGSPGVSRPLTLLRHWRRNLGRRVRVVRQDGSELTGRLVEARDDAVELEHDGARTALRHTDVRRATVQVELTKETQPGKRPQDADPVRGPAGKEG